MVTAFHTFYEERLQVAKAELTKFIIRKVIIEMQ